MAARVSSRWKSAVIIGTGGITAFAVHAAYTGNERFYKDYIMPVLRLADAETAHKLAIKSAAVGFLPRMTNFESPRLKCRLWGRDFPNPVGLAAGFDKHGEAIDGMLSIGFGFVEIGSVTPKPQDGNAKPRVFRLTEDRAIVNRYGFNSDGHDTVLKRLQNRTKYHHDTDDVVDGSGGCTDDRNMLNVNFYSFVGRVSDPPTHPTAAGRRGIVGVNLGKNKESVDAIGDYMEGVKKFGSSADYLVINVSSPNTQGLRTMQQRETLQQLIAKVVEVRDGLSCRRKPPLLVKIAPDLSDQDKSDIAAVVARPGSGVAGLVVSNTTVARPDTLKSKYKLEVGGLSGAPLKDKATSTIRDMYRLTFGRVPIVGVGGIATGADAYEKIRAGASIVQLYTAMAYDGPPVVNKVKRELDQLLERDGYGSVEQAVGADFNEKQPQNESPAN